MSRELEPTANERARGEPASWLAGLMNCYDWTAWQAPECPETDAAPIDAAPVDATGQDAIMRHYQTR